MVDASGNMTKIDNADTAFGGVGVASVSDYFALMKPGVMRLVVFTALVGLLAAPGSIHPLVAFAAILSIAVGAGASAALNMWYDADIDLHMERTKGRPVPAGKVAPEEALNLGVTLSLLSVLSMMLMVNLVAAALLAFTIFFYAVIYTMYLKRRTPQNIVIGGVAGALPPVIGWASVTGTVSLESLALFALIFMWTPPHFWALSLVRSDEYKKVGVPMMTVTAGKKSTRLQMLIYTILLAPISVLPFFLGVGSLVYLGLASIMSLTFIGFAARVWWLGDGREEGRADANRAARSMFFYSILYLFLLFLELLMEHGVSTLRAVL
ncbi:MAG: protoheme IX farnesyltransferase [Alphaproteobacteria bacterium]|nr:MAG: protoheme IX farnesyltransferase [Alphaproteobacteria bacterium]